MIRLQHAILLATLALALAVPGQVVAQGRPTITCVDVPYVDVWVDDPCDQDPGAGYFMTGMTRVRTLLLTTPSGNFLLSNVITPVDVIAEDAYWFWQLPSPPHPSGPVRDVTALALGGTWTIHGTFLGVQHVLPPEGGTFMFTSNLALVGPGPTKTLHTNWHVTVNANGETTVDMLDSWATGCPSPDYS